MIQEKVFGPEHPSVAITLNNLGGLCVVQHRYHEAEPLFRRALAIQEKALGPDHPSVAATLNNLAAVYVSRLCYDQALPLLDRAFKN